MSDLPYEDEYDVGSWAAGERVRTGLTQFPPRPAPVSVSISPAPFTREPSHLEQPEGRSIRAMLVDAVKAGAIDPDDFGRTTIYVDGAALDHDAALDHVLRAGQVVNVAVEAHGGGRGGRKDVGQILLTIAVIAVSAWVSGPAGAAMLGSALMAQVAGAAVLTLGQFAVASLFAPDTAGQAKANDRYALQSASNQYRPWSPFPMALGEVHVAPDLAVKTFTQARGDDVWIYGILGLHYGPCTVEDLKVGDTLVSSLGSEDMQIVEHLTPGARTFSLCPNDIDQADFQEELEATTGSATSVVRAASAEGERFEFDFILPGGLHFAKDDGRILAASVTVTIRYREIDADGDPIGSWTSGTTLPLTSTTKEPWRVMADIGLPMGRYEFEFTRSLKPDANEKRHDDIGLTAIRAIAFRKPVTDETLSLIEFAVRATALNQGTLAPITCRITPIASTWTGSAWGTPEPTSNPAALTRWLMTGPAGARPLTSDEADVGLRAWSALCDDHDWTAHFYLIEDRRQADVMALLEQAGRASLFWDGTQLVASCWVEKPAPVQLFTGANLKDHRWTLVYSEPVHALRVEFQNLDEAGEPDELYVYADGYAETAGVGVAAATLIEGFRLEGQKKPERAYRDGRWELGRRRHQRRVDTWTADAEHVVSRYGQRVRLAWLRVDGGQGVRVRCRRWAGGQVIGLRLNQPLTFIAGQDYALDLRLTDQLLAAVPIDNPATSEPVSTREIVFADPRAANVTPKGGDLVAWGTPDRISTDVEIIGMTPGEDLSCVITGVRYVAPLLMAGETGEIPPLQTRLSRERSADPPMPTLLGVQVDAHGVRVAFGMPPWRGSPITGFSARWRPTPEAGQRTGWVDLPDLSAGSMILTTPALRELPIDGDDVTRVDIEIRAVTASGRASTALAVTAAQSTVVAPGDEWTVAPRPADENGTQQPGLLVVGNVAEIRAAFVQVEYIKASGTDWVGVYDGPPMTEAIAVDGLEPGVGYVIGIAYRSGQGVPSERSLYGPYVAPGLVSGDTTSVGGTTAAELLAFFREIPRLIGDTDLSSEVLIRETLDRHERVVAEETARVAAITAEQAARVAGLLAEAAARGTAIAGVTASVTTVATNLAAEITTRTTQYAATVTSVALVDSRVTTVAGDLTSLTTSVTTQFSTVNGNIAAVSASVTTVAGNLATLTTSVTTQFSTVNGTLASHTTSISTNATAISAETTARTSAISTVNASIASAVSSVTTVATDLAAETTARLALAASTTSGFASVGTSLTALSNADSVLSAAITTAQTTANGASSSATFALSALNGNEAYIALLVDVAGRLTGQRINGATSAIEFLSDSVLFSSASSGARTVYASGIWTSYSADNTVRSMWGKPFGGSEGLVWWTGPNSTTGGSETKANAYVYVSMVAPRFGGSDVPSASPLTASPSSFTVSASGAGTIITSTVTVTAAGAGSGSATIQWLSSGGISARYPTAFTTDFIGDPATGATLESVLVAVVTSGGVRVTVPVQVTLNDTA